MTGQPTTKGTKTVTDQDTHYPQMPPQLDEETHDEYTNRLIGASPTEQRPYNHPRGRQCSIGYHSECSQRTDTGTTIGATGHCSCPHHTDPRIAAGLPHLTSFIAAVQRDAVFNPRAAAVDVLVDMLAEMDAPLRNLGARLRELNLGYAADLLTDVLESRGLPEEPHRDGCRAGSTHRTEDCTCVRGPDY